MFTTCDHAHKILSRHHHLWKLLRQNARKRLHAFFKGNTERMPSLLKVGLRLFGKSEQSCLPSIPLPFPPIYGDGHTMTREMTARVSIQKGIGRTIFLLPWPTSGD